MNGLIKSREQLKKWNIRSSTLTLAIYILYGVFYRLDLPLWYEYSLIAITLFNLVLVSVLLYISLANRHLVDHLKTAVFLGVFRLAINLVLLMLIVNNSF
ncbi:hypothetical protein SAMN05192553_10265 [Cyclobacterium xiamenense]|uniref:Uncharacterized protein n=1 Tax=Cyclobacterium xiamenense TaxID=1297121 RepID=A0A1H6VJE8_9BACT|nr:hypothetical protein [Cyclobacterium xiamenense]SEJ03786.1 hypothetical protein SAMN05192553_10265 [Cyclobacterium xiamenense]